MTIDIHKRFIIETVNNKFIEFLANSNDHVDEFYKSLNREELSIYAEENKRLGCDEETYQKMNNILKSKS
jgi:hypothetical protein